MLAILGGFLLLQTLYNAKHIQLQKSHLHVHFNHKTSMEQSHHKSQKTRYLSWLFSQNNETKLTFYTGDGWWNNLLYKRAGKFLEDWIKYWGHKYGCHPIAETCLDIFQQFHFWKKKEKKWFVYLNFFTNMYTKTYALRNWKPCTATKILP